jgi:glycerol-3-phosphate dehydrogenase
VRHIKGSHIVVPRVHPEAHAYILQNSDQRIVFVIPYQDRFSLIGTTDVPVGAFENPAISTEEVEYLCRTVNAYLARPITPADVVWTYSGVRPLFDDGSSNPSQVTRDYVLKLDAGVGSAPLLSVFGGKLTTYRKLAEHALTELAPFFPDLKPNWTHRRPLPGGDIERGDVAAFADQLAHKYPRLPAEHVRAIATRHGTRSARVLGAAASVADLGFNFGAGLYQAEVDYLVREEWALTAEDVLWRRSKCGLHMDVTERERVAHFMSKRKSPVRA